MRHLGKMPGAASLRMRVLLITELARLADFTSGFTLRLPEEREQSLTQLTLIMRPNKLPSPYPPSLNAL